MSDVLPAAPMPAEVRVGQVVYRVTAAPDDWLKVEHETQTKGYYGHTQNVTATIYINPESPPTVQRLTLWHEVLHAVFNAGMGDPPLADLGDGEEARQERLVRMLEAPTLNVLADNPALVAYLTGA